VDAVGLVDGGVLIRVEQEDAGIGATGHLEADDVAVLFVEAEAEGRTTRFVQVG
jgi:hypothetical protein